MSEDGLKTQGLNRLSYYYMDTKNLTWENQIQAVQSKLNPTQNCTFQLLYSMNSYGQKWLRYQNCSEQLKEIIKETLPIFNSLSVTAVADLKDCGSTCHLATLPTNFDEMAK